MPCRPQWPPSRLALAKGVLCSDTRSPNWTGQAPSKTPCTSRKDALSRRTRTWPGYFSPTYHCVEACVLATDTLKIFLGAVHRHAGFPSNSKCLQNSASLPRENGGEGRQVVIATRFSPGLRGECTYRSDVGYMGGTTERRGAFWAANTTFFNQFGVGNGTQWILLPPSNGTRVDKKTALDIWRPVHPKAHVVATGFNSTARA
ncbi:hypothetical protein QBC32DRAFT_130841 [Pseudoneurospora amorphoporcata]|uniref:Uncharacterized protein n=1 Tax=Pseudoneurospora amorphoporcata TaxID=241081 RepID=A0AAN6NZV6_9PEZI|nr:hypothetical protein QBC32DRAFT_130841 [Pseudoneurospora amorphoporcata]